MFEAKLAECNMFKKIVEAIKDVVVDVNIDVSPAGNYKQNNYLGISLQAMDGSHVALISLSLSSEGFEKYRADSTMVLGVNVGLLSKVMKLSEPQDSLTLIVDNGANYLKMIFQSPKQDRMTQFNLNLITLDCENLAIPETEYCSVVNINSSEFTKICKELYQLNETLIISTNPNFVQFSVDSEAGSGSIQFRQNEDIGLEVSSSVSQQFALRYLNLFNKAAPLSQYARLCMHEDQPLLVEFRIEKLGVLKYYLAPKILDQC